MLSEVQIIQAFLNPESTLLILISWGTIIACIQVEKLLLTLSYIAPSAPTNVSLNVSSTYAYFTWTAPAMPNGLIRYYHLVISDRSDSVVSNITLNDSARSITFTNATPFTQYRLTLIAGTVRDGVPFERFFTTLESSK